MEREREEDQDKDGWTHSRGMRAEPPSVTCDETPEIEREGEELPRLSSGVGLSGGTICRVILPTYYWYRLFTCPNHPSLALLHFSVIFSTLSLSLVLSFLTPSLSVWPNAHLHNHLHLCHFLLHHVGTSLHPVSG